MNMFQFFRVIPNGVPKEYGTLCEIYSSPVERFAFLYESLNILDAKASSLLAFNAIGLAAIAIWLQYVPLNWMHLGLDIVFLLFLFSCVLCLLIIWVFWSPASHFDDPERQAKTLLKLRDRRTRQYRRAWFFSSVAVVVLFVLSTFHTVGTFLYASGRCNEGCQIIYSEGNWGNRDSIPRNTLPARSTP